MTLNSLVGWFMIRVIVAAAITAVIYFFVFQLLQAQHVGVDLDHSTHCYPHTWDRLSIRFTSSADSSLPSFLLWNLSEESNRWADSSINRDRHSYTIYTWARYSRSTRYRRGTTRDCLPIDRSLIRNRISSINRDRSEWTRVRWEMLASSVSIRKSYCAHYWFLLLFSRATPSTSSWSSHREESQRVLATE